LTLNMEKIEEEDEIHMKNIEEEEEVRRRRRY
jgi:hypothetical protein